MFDSHEITLNQQGQLSERQAKRLAQTIRLRQMGWQCAAFAFAATALFLLAMPLLSDEMPLTRDSWIGLGVVIAVIALVFGVSRWHEFRRSADLRHRKIRVVEGPASTTTRQIHMRGGAKLPRYELTIGEVEFYVESPAMLAFFQEGAWYRVYYIHYPPPHIVLSAEKMPTMANHP